MNTHDTFHLGIKGLIRNSNGEVLLLKVNPEALKKDTTVYWDLPGGRIYKGEAVEDALKREVMEETAITNVSEIKEVGMVLAKIRIPLSETEDVGLILGIYECKVDDNASVTLSQEHTEYKWFSPEEAGELLKVKYPENFTNKIKNL